MKVKNKVELISMRSQGVIPKGIVFKVIEEDPASYRMKGGYVFSKEHFDIADDSENNGRMYFMQVNSDHVVTLIGVITAIENLPEDAILITNNIHNYLYSR